MSGTENRCANCPYRWQDDGDDWPTCHWEDQYPGDKAPCEYDD